MVPGKSQRQVKCRFCLRIISYRGDRMLAHLGYRPPLEGACDVFTYRMVSLRIRVLFEEYGGIVPEHVGIVNKHPLVQDDIPLEPF